MADLRLLVNGKEYAGWTSASVTRSLETIAGSFALTVSERWGGQAQPWPIREEDECELQLEGERFKGYVDDRTQEYDAEAHSLTVAGLETPGALVQNCVDGEQWEFLNVSVPAFCRKITAPFNIPIALQSGLSIDQAIPKLTIDPGDTAFEAISRACEIVGVLPISDGNGGVLLTRAGTERTRTALVEGENILRASVTFDAKGRFRKYVVRGQTAGDDEQFGTAAASVKGTATDMNVKRAERVLVVRPSGAVNIQLAQQRAAWEATVRAGRSAAVEITVQGWRQAAGASLWPINAKVPVNSPMLAIDGEMLIKEATFSLSEQAGELTTLRCVWPDAFAPEPVIPKKSAAGGDSRLS